MELPACIGWPASARAQHTVVSIDENSGAPPRAWTGNQRLAAVVSQFEIPRACGFRLARARKIAAITLPPT